MESTAPSYTLAILFPDILYLFCKRLVQPANSKGDEDARKTASS
jgi:hypothetical protein